MPRTTRNSNKRKRNNDEDLVESVDDIKRCVHADAAAVDTAAAAPDFVESSTNAVGNRGFSLDHILPPGDGDNSSRLSPTVDQLAAILTYIESSHHNWQQQCSADGENNYGNGHTIFDTLDNVFYRDEVDYDDEFVEMKKNLIELGARCGCSCV
jgi:hypothetical protein